MESDFDVHNFHLERHRDTQVFVCFKPVDRKWHSGDERSETSLARSSSANEPKNKVGMRARRRPYVSKPSCILAGQKENAIVWVRGELGRSHCWKASVPTITNVGCLWMQPRVPRRIAPPLWDPPLQLWQWGTKAKQNSTTAGSENSSGATFRLETFYCCCCFVLFCKTWKMR